MQRMQAGTALPTGRTLCLTACRAPLHAARRRAQSFTSGLLRVGEPPAAGPGRAGPGAGLDNVLAGMDDEGIAAAILVSGVLACAWAGALKALSDRGPRAARVCAACSRPAFRRLRAALQACCSHPGFDELVARVDKVWGWVEAQLPPAARSGQGRPCSPGTR